MEPVTIGAHVPTTERSQLLSEADVHHALHNHGPSSLAADRAPGQSNAHLPEADTHDNPERSRQHSTPTPPGAHTPLPAGGVLEPPIPNYLAMVSDASTPRDSYGPKSFDDSNQGLAGEQPTDHDDDYHQPQKRKSIFSRPVFWLAASAAIVLIVLVVILPVYFTVIKKDKSAALSTENDTPHLTESENPVS